MSEDFDRIGKYLPEPSEFAEAFEQVERERFLHELQPERYAILDAEGNIQPASLYSWGQYLQSHENRIAQTKHKGYRVSTVFLGLNHQYLPDLPPLWFETMIFTPEYERTLSNKKKIMLGDELWCKRTSTKAEAIQAHQEGIAWLKNYLIQSHTEVLKTNARQRSKNH